MSKIIPIHSYRGGTGKSNLCANLAAVVAAQGRRVGIVDTDIQSPGIHILFDLSEERIQRSLNDYLRGLCPIKETAYDITPPEVRSFGGNLQLIPSSLKVGEITRVLREGYDVGLMHDGFRDLLEQLRLDFLFIDTHPGLNEETLLSIAISDILLLILRPDRQDFQGTAVTVDVARKLEVKQILLLINKALPRQDTGALQKQVEWAYGAKVVGIFPETEEMAALGSSGLFCLRYPEHALTDELRRVATQLLS